MPAAVTMTSVPGMSAAGEQDVCLSHPGLTSRRLVLIRPSLMLVKEQNIVISVMVTAIVLLPGV